MPSSEFGALKIFYVFLIPCEGMTRDIMSINIRLEQYFLNSAAVSKTPNKYIASLGKPQKYNDLFQRPGVESVLAMCSVLVKINFRRVTHILQQIALNPQASRKKFFLVARPLRGGGVRALPLRKNTFFEARRKKSGNFFCGH